MNSPSVGIVIPVYNTRTCVGDATESVLAQDYSI